VIPFLPSHPGITIGALWPRSRSFRTNGIFSTRFLLILLFFVLNLFGWWTRSRLITLILIDHTPRINRQVKLIDCFVRIDGQVKLVDRIVLRSLILFDIESVAIGFDQWLLNRFKELVEVWTLSFVVLLIDLEGHSDFLTEFDVVVTVHKSECKNLLTGTLRKFNINRNTKLFVRVDALIIQSERSKGMLRSIVQLQLHICWPCNSSWVLECATNIVAGSCGSNDISWLLNAHCLKVYIGWGKEWFKTEYFTEDRLEFVKGTTARFLWTIWLSSSISDCLSLLSLRIILRVWWFLAFIEFLDNLLKLLVWHVIDHVLVHAFSNRLNWCCGFQSFSSNSRPQHIRLVWEIWEHWSPHSTLPDGGFDLILEESFKHETHHVSLVHGIGPKIGIHLRKRCTV